jgi:hypothetical protein
MHMELAASKNNYSDVLHLVRFQLQSAKCLLTLTVYKAVRDFNVTSQIKSLIMKTKSVDRHKRGVLIQKGFI